MYTRQKRFIFIFCFIVSAFVNSFAQQQFELENNFLQNLSFITGQNRGIVQNLDDNFGWMQAQGYTHLRFFGIFPNGHHTFPSPTLDANNYPTSPNLENTLAILVTKANQYGITVNFDGWEVLAESNRDTTFLGVGYLTEEEVAAVVQDVLSLGVNLITEEQFAGSYLQAIQSVTSQMGATHETTAEGWWLSSAYADEQLASVFNFYHYDQGEIDSLTDTYPPSNLGNLQASAESTRYWGYPFSIAVGSFGNLETENWKNVLLFAQILHHPERFSIEEKNTAFTIWDPNFNFMEYVGNEILSFANDSLGDRPIANMVIDRGWINNPSFRPAINGSIINRPTVVNTLSLLGYQVIVTVDSVLPDAEIYYLQLAGGVNTNDIAPLPDYVLPLLNGNKPVFLQPCYGIPDENDSPDWSLVGDFFGLPAGDTQTLANLIPETVVYENFTTRWGGVNLWLTPRIEYLLSSQVDSSIAQVVLSGEIYQQDIALVIRNNNKFLINSNLIHLEASFIFSTLLGGPLNSPATADIVIGNDMTLIFAEYNTSIDVNLPWTGITHVIRYDPQGNRILDTDIDLGGNYSETLLRGEFVYLRDVLPSSVYNPNSSDGNLPVDFSLLQNYPNPFNPTTKITFTIPTSTKSPPYQGGEAKQGWFVQLKVYDVLGNEITTLVNEDKPAGTYEIEFDASNLPSGVYFYSIVCGSYSEIKKMILLR